MNPSLPVKSLPQLIQYARENPGKIDYASGNVNGILAAAQLSTLANLEMVHVPYKGEPLAIPDLITGRVQMMFGSGIIVAPLVKEGKLRALATLLPARSGLLPDVPTVGEAGMPGLSVLIWGGLFGPAKLPKDIVGRISDDVNAILKRADVRQQFERLGVEPAGATPDEFGTFLKQQLVDWGRVAREAGMRPE